MWLDGVRPGHNFFFNALLRVNLLAAHFHFHTRLFVIMNLKVKVVVGNGKSLGSSVKKTE